MACRYWTAAGDGSAITTYQRHGNAFPHEGMPGHQAAERHRAGLQPHADLANVLMPGFEISVLQSAIPPAASAAVYFPESETPLATQRAAGATISCS